MPGFRMTSATVAPDSAYVSAKAICSSVALFLLIEKHTLSGDAKWPKR
jgi:hypothetical protein